MDDGSQHLELFPGLNIPSVPLSDQSLGGFQSGSGTHHEDSSSLLYSQDTQIPYQHWEQQPQQQHDSIHMYHQQLDPEHHLMLPQSGVNPYDLEQTPEHKYLVQANKFQIVDASQHHHHHHHHHHQVDVDPGVVLDNGMVHDHETDEEPDPMPLDPRLYVAPITMTRFTSSTFPKHIQMQQLHHQQQLLIQQQFQQQQLMHQQQQQALENAKKRKRSESMDDEDQLRLDTSQNQLDIPQFNQFAYQKQIPQQVQQKQQEDRSSSPDLDDSQRSQKKKRRGVISLDKRVFSKSSIEQSAPSVYCSVEKGMLNGKQYWTKNEDEKLKEAVATYGTDWVMVASMFNGERTGAQVSQRWNRVLNPNLKKGRWTEQEDILLQQLVQIHGEKAWSTIASKMKDRSDIQCRSHYFRVTKNRKNSKSSSKSAKTQKQQSQPKAKRENTHEDDLSTISVTSSSNDWNSQDDHQHQQDQDDQQQQQQMQMQMQQQQPQQQQHLLHITDDMQYPPVFNQFASDSEPPIDVRVRIKLTSPTNGNGNTVASGKKAKSTKTKTKKTSKTKAGRKITKKRKKTTTASGKQRKTAKQKKAEAAAVAAAAAAAEEEFSSELALDDDSTSAQSNFQDQWSWNQ